MPESGYRPINHERMHDWGFYSDDPRGALGGAVAHWCFWWNEDYQRRFEEIWGPDAELLADELADHYGYIWPWLIDTSLTTRAPNTFAQIEYLLSDEELISRTNGTNPPVVVHNSIVWGSFHTVRKRRTWAEPEELTCPVCEKKFWSGNLPIWTYRQFGQARYCSECCLEVRNRPNRNWNSSSLLLALKNLSDAMGSIPPENYSFQPLAGVQEEKRDRIVAALCQVPDALIFKEVLGAKYWLNVLQMAGVVGNAWRPSRGTWCIATDGHRCRSLLEKSIDDWFSQSGLRHECEPQWPTHPIYNPSGKKRADWLLPSGSFVECVGMMSDNGYAAKIKEKQQLAAEIGIKLYLVSSSDILVLDKVFQSEL